MRTDVDVWPRPVERTEGEGVEHLALHIRPRLDIEGHLLNEPNCSIVDRPRDRELNPVLYQRRQHGDTFDQAIGFDRHECDGAGFSRIKDPR